MVAALKAKPEGRTTNNNNRYSSGTLVPIHPSLLELPTPDPPPHLGEVGRDVWRMVWIIGTGSFNPGIDGFIVERYATMQERRWKMMQELEDQPYTISDKGRVAINPLAALLLRTESLLVALEDRLGLSPEARIRLGIGAIEHRSKLDSYLDSEAAMSDTG